MLEVAVGERRAVERLAGCLPAELAVEPVVVGGAGVGHDRSVRGSEVGEVCRSSTSAWSVAQNRSILPFVQGVSIWVRMWRISRSASLRWNRLSIVRRTATNGVPLSVMSSCGTPHSRGGTLALRGAGLRSLQLQPIARP